MNHYINFMRTSFLSILAIFLTSCVSNNNQIYKEPYEYDNGHMYIDIINKNKTYNFLFDTGAEVCALDSSITGDFIISNKSSYVINETKIVENFQTDLQMGPYIIGEVQSIEYGFRQNDPPIDIDGIIGQSYFANFVIGLDYLNQDILLGFSSEEISKEFRGDFHILEIIRSSEYMNIYVEIEINNRIYLGLIDTGAHESKIPMKVIDDIRDINPKLVKDSNIVKELQSFAIGNQMERGNKISYVTLPSLKIGDLAYENLSFKGWKQDFIVLGNDFLGNFTWIIDFRNKEVLFKPEIGENDSLVMNEYIEEGFSIYTYPNGKQIVKEVVLDSYQWQLGLRPNMEIINIVYFRNGKIRSLEHLKDDGGTTVFELQK